MFQPAMMRIPCLLGYLQHGGVKSDLFLELRGTITRFVHQIIQADHRDPITGLTLATVGTEFLSYPIQRIDPPRA
jgi:hypothetical protein